LNNWTITGRLGADAELRHTQNGDPVLNARVAVDGRKKGETLWVGATVFGKRAEALAPYLLKGQRIGVTGRAQLREFERRDGTAGTSLELLANDVALLGGPRREGGERPGPSGGHVGGGGGGEFADDDIPFYRVGDVG
jgi:single-strand DNA-binding protein